jgi:hypothetical protein
MLKDLKPFKAPVPVEREACHACKTFAPECLVPDGDEALPMCWLCAHHVIDHNTSIASAHCAECECTPREIYPKRVFEEPGAVVAIGPEPTPAQRRRAHFEEPQRVRGSAPVAAVAQYSLRCEPPKGK